MSLSDQIKQIEALRNKAVASFERASALAEKHRKEADEFNIAIDVLTKIAPPNVVSVATAIAPVARYGGGLPSASDITNAPIYKRILNVLKSSDQMWWTANQIQDALKALGDDVKMTSISPNLSRLKESGDIVRDDLKVALADRAPQNAETPEDDLLGRNSSGASNQHDFTNRGTQPSSLVKPWAGGGT